MFNLKAFIIAVQVLKVQIAMDAQDTVKRGGAIPVTVACLSSCHPQQFFEILGQSQKKYKEVSTTIENS